MLKKIRQKFTRNFINIPGWRTRRKIVVIESDDWGSIRMPSREVYEKMLKAGIRVDKDPYNKYDSLATVEDLEALFDILSSVKDKYGNPAVLTANTVVANPCFEKIKESGFSQYFYEPFIETLKRSKATERAFEYWKQGMEAGVFHPQLHGREHLNVKKWMELLQKDDKVLKTAFDHQLFGITSSVYPDLKGSLMGAFDYGSDEDIVFQKNSLRIGSDLFKNILGYPSESFIATRYTWSPAIENTLIEGGVKFLQGTVSQKIPLKGGGFNYKNNNFQGAQSKAGLIYLTRNCYFEPSLQPDFNWIDDCLNRIRIAFRWNKAAVIGMHRLNVIGALDKSNRTNNLLQLKMLLTEIVKRYPQVEFMSSDKLGRIIANEDHP